MEIAYQYMLTKILKSYCKGIKRKIT
jgi:hypothetical protein